MNILKNWVLGMSASLCLLGAIAPAAAAEFPEKAVRVVIPFPAGAAADAAMRVVAKKMSELWRQPVVIENRPGVAGILSVVTAPADGYTVLLGAGSSFVTAPLMGKLAYSPSRDFTPVSRLVVNVPVLVAHPSAGIRTVSELIAAAKKSPGKLDFSSSGNGSPGHLSMELFQSLTDTQLTHIPYKGGATAVNDLLGGQVPLGINALPSVIQHIKSGKLLALAVASPTRSAAAPDVPTMAQAGVTGFEYDIWYGLFAPSKTPPELVAKLSAGVRTAMADPEVKRLLTDQGAMPAATTPDELDRFIKSDTATWQKLIKDRKLSLEP
jgi:tripartite-type tricarboxylate transporter receptor subunit TctC